MNEVDIVLSGGGLGYPFHVGFLKALTESGIWPRRIWGTSAGSMIGGLFATGVSIKSLERMVRTLEPNRYVSINFWSVLRARIYGYITNGKSLLRRLNKETGGLLLKDVPDFTAIATDITTETMVQLNHKEFPSMPVSTAILSSMSIPIIFRPVKWDQDDKTLLLSDGGLMKNFAIDIAQQNSDNHSVIGCLIKNRDKGIDHYPGFWQWPDVIIGNLVDGNVKEAISDFEFFGYNPDEHIVGVENQLSLTEFDVDTDQRVDMMNRSYEAAKAFLKNKTLDKTYKPGYNISG